MNFEKLYQSIIFPMNLKIVSINKYEIIVIYSITVSSLYAIKFTIRSDFIFMFNLKKNRKLIWILLAIGIIITGRLYVRAWILFVRHNIKTQVNTNGNKQTKKYKKWGEGRQKDNQPQCTL